jgi:Concanavalin A-like lectin/glucanases superfamily
MNRDGCFSLMNLCLSLCAAAALAVIGSSTHAATPTNKYTFNDNTANDSIGGANGVIVDNTGISKFVGGAFDMSANNGANSNQDFSNPATAGAFIDLPNGVFTNAVDTGNFGAVSLEVWFTTQQNQGWAEVYSFGHNDAGDSGEGMSSGGGSYVALIPTAGDAPNDFRATTRDQAGMTDSYVNHDSPLSALPVGVKQHVVFVLNELDDNGGLNPNGTERLYLNGADVGSNAIATIIDSLELSDVNNWLGRSQWGDPLFDGSIDEFRIYNTALTPGEVTASYAAGPDPAPLPVLIVDRDTGAMSLANRTAGNVQIKGYSVTSADGGLNPATWTSIDAGNAFDPDGTWTAQSSMSTNLAESVTSGTLDGGTLAPAASSGIGTPWFKTPFEDIAFSFTLGDGSTANGTVQYIGTPLMRSDLNGDGLVTVADWALFLTNSFTSFPSETTVGAYLKGDLDGDLDNDHADFLIFKADFIAANGAGAFAQLTGAVPEPSSLALAAMVCAMLLGTGRDQRES